MQPIILRRLPQVLVLILASSPALALDTVLENVSIDNGDKSTVLMKRVEVTGTNLTQDELKKLFSGATSKDERKQLAARLQAARIAIPEITVTGTEKGKEGKVTAVGFQADNIDKGRAGHLTLASFSGDVAAEDNGRATLKSGPIALDGADMTGFLASDAAAATPGMTPFTHFSWQGFEIAVPDKSSTASQGVYAIKMDSLVVDGTYDGKVPLHTSGKLNSLTIVPPAGSDAAQGLGAAGYDKLDLGLTFAGTYNPAAQTYTVEDYTITGVNAGALGLKGQFGAIDKAAFTGQKDEKINALMKGSIANLELKFANAGLFEKAATLYGKQQGKTLAQVQQEWSMMAAQFVPMMLGGDPNAPKIGAALASFVNNPKVLTVTAKAKTGNVAFSDLMAIKSPPMLLQKVDLNAVATAK